MYIALAGHCVDSFQVDETSEVIMAHLFYTFEVWVCRDLDYYPFQELHRVNVFKCIFLLFVSVEAFDRLIVRVIQLSLSFIGIKFSY